MKKKIVSIILTVLLIITNISFIVNAEVTYDYTLEYMENTSKGNIHGYKRILFEGDEVDILVGYVPAGKIVIVSAIPTYGGLANTYISAIGLWPQVSTENFHGFSSENSLMSYFKIETGNDYVLKVVPKMSSNVYIDIYVYTVDYIDGFVPHNAVEGNGADNYNYVVSNKPEHLGKVEGRSISLENINETSSTLKLESSNSEKTVLVDGTERELPVKAEPKLVRKSRNSTQKITVDKDIKKIFEKINNGEKLGLSEMDNYYDFINENNLMSASTLAIENTSHLGEYGYYLSKSKINGNANVFWEQISYYGEPMYYGVLLQNTSNSSLKVTLNKRSFDCTDSNQGAAMNNIWRGFFTGEKVTDSSDLKVNETLTIPANSARWVALYLIPTYSCYDTFNGQVSISIKNSSNQIYTGEDLYCYTFIMTNWENPATGDQMHEVVKNSIGNGTFTRAADATAYDQSTHISGSGDGARLLKSVNNVIDITDDRYSFILTGEDAPYLNDGERIILYHAGPVTGGTSSYVIPNSMNYGVIYKLGFAGFNSTNASETIKLKLKYNALLNPYAAAANDGGIYATLVCNQISSQPYTTIIGDPGSGYPSEQEIWTIPKNTPFDLYIVIGGLSSLPVEVQFYAQ